MAAGQLGLTVSLNSPLLPRRLTAITVKKGQGSG
jgi:hypothetical protein